MALPAFIASRIESRIGLDALITDILDERTKRLMLDQFDGEVTDATKSLCERLSDVGSAQVHAAIDETASLDRRPPHRNDRSRSVIRGDSLILPAGCESDDHIFRKGLQEALCAIFDSETLDELASKYRANEQFIDVRRLEEIRDHSTSHEWLECVNTCYGPCLTPEEYVTAVRLRIGAPSIGDSMVCPRCNTATLDPPFVHALCCSRGESTKGQYCVRDEAINLVHLADVSACTEILELILDRPSLRPADIFTSAAIPGRMAALDIGICSPDASHASDDCCEQMMRTKLSKYSKYERALDVQGVTYKPLIFSCYGRCHPDTVTVLDYIARRAA